MSSNSNGPSYIQRRHALESAKYVYSTKVPAGAGKGSNTVDAKDVVGWIYSVLTTLDTKASALMRLNGVLIAAAAFMLGLFGRLGESILSTTKLDAILIILCALLSAVSITLCLYVVNVSWPFLGKVKNDTSGNFDFAEEIESLDKASNRRQCAYRSAWWISLLASIGFLAEFLWQTAYVICFSS